jgi:hypothetical protein
MRPYQILLHDWQSALSKKWLMLDSSAVNIIADFQASGIMQELQPVISILYINPVLLEVNATSKNTLVPARQALLRLCNELPFTRLDVNESKALQQELRAMDVRPSPTDLYLGAFLRQFANMLLLTENVSDFPTPHFERVGYIVIEGPKSSRLLTVIKAPS